MKKIWMFIYIVFFRNIPDWIPLGGKLRNFAVRHFLLQCGKTVSIGFGCRIHKNTKLGNHSGVGRNSEIMNGVTIKDDVMIGPNVYMCTETHNFSDPDTLTRLQGFLPRKPIVIENNVWIGANVIILPGVTIGEGSVIGAGTVVPKDIPAYSVAVGNPARIVKNRKSL